MKKILSMSLILITTVILAGCTTGMRLGVKTLPQSSLYGKVQPRAAADKCRWYNKGNSPNPSIYNVLAKYIIQEKSTFILNDTASQMICYAFKKAIKNGADAIIVDEVSTTNVAGGHARTSPFVKVSAIRFKGALPKSLMFNINLYNPPLGGWHYTIGASRFKRGSSPK